jgi:predicted transcriptional regulator
MLESLCHAKRFEILKAISGQTMSFSALSKLTDLRGGNLLFHLQKLTDSGMILQQHERGDYMITSKGFKVMEGIGDIYSSLAPGEN